MAYAALLSLTRTLDNILLSREESLVRDEELQIKSLHQKLSLFISFLNETSQKNSDSIEDLEERIRDAVYEAEDIVESHMTKQILSKSEDQNSEENYEEDINNVMEKLDSLWGEMEKMKDNNIEALKIKDRPIGPATPVEVESTSEIVEVEKMQSRNVSSSQSTSTDTKEPMVGLEDNILRIKELLAGSSSKLDSTCIVGMGGIGKTTLARSIYDEPFVCRHFDVRAWITVSQKYNVIALLIDLLKSMGTKSNEISGKSMAELKQKVYQSLKQRRYLIIIDDLWDIDFLKEFKNILPDDNTRSRIIMTSRSKMVNFEHHSSHIHCMNFLSPEQSWNLLRRKALGEESCPLEVEEIGRKIADKCKGLPLSLGVVGGLLHKGKKTRAYWKYVEKNMKSMEAGNYDDLIEVLSWSYKHLPHHLRACFLYIAVYPEDYVIDVAHLMRLWLAEGFIKQTPPKNLEQAAMEHLEELIDRNLIIVRDRTYYGEIKTCTIHDLIRDLCIRKARGEIFLHLVGKDKDDKEAIKNQRFLSIYLKYWFESAQMRVSTVRSHIYFAAAYQLTGSMHFPLLRVLDALCIRLENFPIGITELVNLRYLTLFYDGRENGDILGSISKLCNLQTLIIIRRYIHYRNFLLYLPAEMTKMQWLRHLQVDGSKFIYFDEVAPNWQLQVLSGLTDFSFTMDAIEKIRDIKILGILYRGDDDEIVWSTYHLENLVHLHQLRKLKLECISYLNTYQLPPNLSFPQKLNELSLFGFEISWKDLSMIGSHSNLQVLKLKDVSFENNVCKTNEGEFSELKFLLIESMMWEDWEAKETHFPSLECLRLRDCLKLKCIPHGIGHIPTLRHIVLDEYCSEGVEDSANEILKEQHEFGNENLQLHEGVRSKISFHTRYFPGGEYKYED